MATELMKISFDTEAGILHVHQAAMQLAHDAGMSIGDQLRFAVSVAEQCLSAGKDEVIFSVQDAGTNSRKLKAVWGIHPLCVEKEFAVRPGQNGLSFQVPAQAYKSREEDYRDMQQFTFALAHDLKNSLTKLKLASSLLEGEEIPPAISNYLQIIQRASGRLEGILEGLSQVIKSGHSSPDVVKKLSPALIFADVCEEFSDTIGKSGAIINTDFSGVPELHYIEVYLKSIFTNLISNAIKYAAPGRPLQLDITAVKQDGRYIFSFTDNGTGIDLERYGNRLFQPFTRFASNTEGSGIGLYLIKNIIERNGGTLHVDSRPGEGTTFLVFLREYPQVSALSL